MTYLKNLVFRTLLTGIVLSLFLVLSTEAQRMSSDSLVSPQPESLRLEPRKTPPVKKSPTGAMIRSALFPGWGQFYTEHYVKSGLFFCIESSLIISALIQDKKARDVYQTDYETYLERLDRRNGYLWWTAGVIVFSMIDAYVDGHLFGFDEDQFTLGLKPSLHNSGFNVVLFIDL